MRTILAALLLSSACAQAWAQDRTPAAYEVALRNEVGILNQGLVQRKPAEANTTFLKRLFPASFEEGKPLTYAWRPSVYGEQLFFSHGQRNEFHQVGEGTELFVLDPIQLNKYAVQVLLLKPIGDITNLAAFFFTDVDQDKQKELLALVYAEVQQVEMPKEGEQVIGRLSQWQTQVFRYTGPSRPPALPVRSGPPTLFKRATLRGRGAAGAGATSATTEAKPTQTSEVEGVGWTEWAASTVPNWQSATPIVTADGSENYTNSKVCPRSHVTLSGFSKELEKAGVAYHLT